MRLRRDCRSESRRPCRTGGAYPALTDAYGAMSETLAHEVAGDFLRCVTLALMAWGGWRGAAWPTGAQVRAAAGLSLLGLLLSCLLLLRVQSVEI